MALHPCVGAEPARTFVTMPERNRMRAMRAAGASRAEIAAETGRGPATIYRHAGDIPSTAPRGPRRRLSPAERARLLRDADDGWSHRMLARRFGLADISVKTIVCIMRRERRLAAAAQSEARP